MDGLLGLKVFREVVDAGSFAGAAERLGLSAAMTSKHIAALERRVGARLLNRTSRHLSLTEAGERYHAHAAGALELLDEAEAELLGIQDRPRGLLRVTAPVWAATPRFARMLVDYHARYPEVVVDLRLENRKVDLASEGFDLALRVTNEPTPSLVARPVCPIRLLLVAAPAYLDRAGRPAGPDDIPRLDAILPTYVDMSSVTMNGPAGPARLRPRSVLKTDDTLLALRAVQAGLGIAWLPDVLIVDDLAEGRLERLLSDHEHPPFMLHALWASRRFTPPKLRSFVDFAVAALG
ncbi:MULTISPECIES: LysR family transcriptional regulator [Derxia]|uniref:LysR family transcriptional regulator n=1 Tax=Derxia gummosa DSM 723 TaxID=1121388 RepID=A0A8B6X211_9BURK|nr:MULTISPECIES: LysR family transcriptional regulator [Derxia]